MGIRERLSGKGVYYDNKVKVTRLKEMAQTLLYLEQKDYPDFAVLASMVDEAKDKFYTLSEKIKAAEKRMAEIAVLKTHIINYSKTRDVYAGYRKAGYSKKYLAEHESEIILHKAAKKAFDELGLKKLPTVKTLQTEYAALLAEKKSAYAGYNAAQTEMRSMFIHKANAEYLLGLDRQEEDRQKERQREEK